MVSMLTQNLITIGSSSETAVNRLQDIEKSVESGQKEDGRSALNHLKQESEGSRDRMGSSKTSVDLDAATGLPNKTEADTAIREAMASPRVRREIRQFADTKLEKTTEVGQRTVLIFIAANWSTTSYRFHSRLKLRRRWCSSSTRASQNWRPRMPISGNWTTPSEETLA